MLVLTREVGESVRVGDTIVTVLSKHGGSIRLGFEAPSNVAIVRTEIDSAQPAPPKIAERKSTAAFHQEYLDTVNSALSANRERRRAS